MIFVTGGNGFIGSRVVYTLLEKGYSVKVLLRKNSKTDRIDSLPITRCYGDVLDLPSLQAGMQGCSGVIHLACMIKGHDMVSPKMSQIVIEGSKNVFEAAKNLKVVYVSSSNAINGTTTPVLQNEESSFSLPKDPYLYAWAKNQVEQLCKIKVKRGAQIVIVNPSTVLGPNDYDQITCGYFAYFARTNPIFSCTGGINIVHVDDVANGIVAALEKGAVGERYFLGGENLTLREAGRLAQSCLCQKKLMIPLNNNLALFLSKYCRKLLPVHSSLIPYACRYWFFNNKKAQKELGATFRPARQTLEETLGWMKQKQMI